MYKFGVIFIIYGEIMVSLLALFVNGYFTKILIDYINKVKLDRGLDWKFHSIKGKGKLREDQLNNSYFTQTPGSNSDITTIKNYDISSNG